MLELSRACKRFESPGEVVHAVEDATVTIAPSEFVAVFGPSGSGKTTLLMLAGGLLRADAGAVLFEGTNLACLTRREMLEHRRLKLGLVFQDFRLSDGLSAVENVMVPMLMRRIKRRDAFERAHAALSDVGLEHRAHYPPERLSGGERQRVAIARALVGQPKLLLADEPTGNLDSETSASVLELMSALPRERGAAVILVTHNLQLGDYADRVMAMRDGRLTQHEAEPAQP